MIRFEMNCIVTIWTVGYVEINEWQCNFSSFTELYDYLRLESREIEQLKGRRGRDETKY